MGFRVGFGVGFVRSKLVMVGLCIIVLLSCFLCSNQCYLCTGSSKAGKKKGKHGHKKINMASILKLVRASHLHLICLFDRITIVVGCMLNHHGMCILTTHSGVVLVV